MTPIEWIAANYGSLVIIGIVLYIIAYNTLLPWLKSRKGKKEVKMEEKVEKTLAETQRDILKKKIENLNAEKKEIDDEERQLDIDYTEKRMSLKEKRQILYFKYDMYKKEWENTVVGDLRKVVR